MALIKQLPLGPMQTNCYILACQETMHAAVIDPSADGETIANTLAEDGLTLTHILITHAHFDHVGGLGDLKERYPDVPVYVHADANPMMKMADKQAAMFGMRFPPAPEGDIMLNEGDTLTVGNETLDVLYTPGHAPGHVSFLLQDHPIIFSGDVLFQGSIGRTDLPGADFSVLMDSIEQKLLVLADETQVLSGHGPVTTIGAEKAHNPFLQ